MTMINLKNILGTFLILTLLFSCGGEEPENKPETPKALQDNKLEIDSYIRKGVDLTEELYQELVDKTPALKELENDIDAFSQKPSDCREKFSKYDGKSNSYYGSAEYRANSIADSLLRAKILALIRDSRSKYSAKTTELNSLLEQIAKDNTTLRSHHSVLKIVMTLPLIEKYQDDNLPDKKEFREIIKEQEKLIERTDSLTPNY